uniref:Peptidase M28 domain-containing protein n=1 Tax=Arcella intermedia TaxID=1963864 RepID=A0A6B2KYR1_9EUKA
MSSTKTFILCGLFLVVTASFATTLVLFLINVSHPKTNIDYDALHAIFDKNVNSQQIREYVRQYSSVPHLAGSPADEEQAINTTNLWKSYGIDAHMEEHQLLLNYPVSGSVSVIYPPELAYTCTLKEGVVNDGTSGYPTIPPLWNGFSASGDVQGDLVYVNYGTAEDFEAIRDIDLTGKIVIVRYGQLFRGNKAKTAEERGAVGVIIYSDPGDNEVGTSYPDGPWGTNSTGQRGAVWTGNGDPLTPGWPSDLGAPRLSLNEAQQGSQNTPFGKLPGIPIQPMSSGDAYHLLKGLQGNRTLPGWEGGFNLSFIGPGPVRVSMSIETTLKVTPAWNVIGTIKGAVEPDRMVVLGAHRDAWTFGAVDPISGHSGLMETARVLGLMLKEGWRPKRTIVLCSWDAEEYGLVGSFEFTEKWRTMLASNAILYMNLDTAITGHQVLSVSGTPALQDHMVEISKKLNFTTSSGEEVSLYSIWDDPKVRFLGSGSDFTSFIQRLGISSIDMDISNRDGDYWSIYHSAYDSFYWVEHFGDPGFIYHQALVRFYGAVVLSIVDADVLPFDYRDYAALVNELFEDLERSSSGVGLNYTFFKGAMESFQVAAQSAKDEADRVRALGKSSRGLNERLFRTERCFIGDSDTSGHRYFLHVISTPSADNSYAPKPFPAIYAALEENDIPKAQFIMDRIALNIQQAAQYLSFSFVTP